MTDVAREKYEELKKGINLHNYRYHVLDDPLISDYEFDQLLVALRDIEQSHSDWIMPDSPTQRSGAPPDDAFVKVSHPAPILSLANAFSEQEVRDWYDRILKLDDRIEETEFILEPKFDGLTVVLHYQDGVFAHCDPDRCGIWTTFYRILNMQYVIGGYCGYGREPSTEDMKLFMERMRERAIFIEERMAQKVKEA